MAKPKAPPVVNLFATAETVAAPAKVQKDKSKNRAQLELGRELDQLAAIVALEKTLKGFKIVLDTSLKARGLDVYIQEGLALGRQPENMEGLGDVYRDKDGQTTDGLKRRSKGSVQVKCRASNSPLTEDQVAVLDAMGIPYETEQVTEEMFYFNPAILADQEKMVKISEALSKVPGLDVNEVIKRREGVSKKVACDESINKIFALKLNDPDRIKELLLSVVTQAIRPTIDDPSLTNIFNILAEAGLSVGRDYEREAADAEKAASARRAKVRETMVSEGRGKVVRLK